MNEIVAINQRTWREKIASYKKRPISFLILLTVILAMAITMGAFLFLVLYILIKGIPHLTPSLFAWEYNTENVSMFPAIINTLLMTLLTATARKIPSARPFCGPIPKAMW